MSAMDDARERQAKNLIGAMLYAQSHLPAPLGQPKPADPRDLINSRDDARASLMRMLASVPPEPPQKPAQAGATPGVVGVVLPCPFCGAPPRVVTVPSGKFYGCQTCRAAAAIAAAMRSNQ